MNCQACNKHITGKEMINALRSGGMVCYDCMRAHRTAFIKKLEELKIRKPELFHDEVQATK